jgi:hypothetical protein
VEIIDKPYATVNEIISDQKMRARLTDLGGTVLTLSSAMYRELLSSYLWTKFEVGGLRWKGPPRHRRHEAPENALQFAEIAAASTMSPS